MICTLEKRELTEYVKRQLTYFFPDNDEIRQLDSVMAESLERLGHCLSAVADVRFYRNGEAFFNHLHSDQYAMFLYLLSNTLFQRYGLSSICEKLFFLNKALYGIDVFCEVELPRIFLFCHAGGTVLGRARYSDYFIVYQNCTVGSARAAKGAIRGEYPILGKHCSLYVGSAIMGACRIGDNCKISANSVIMNKKLKPNTIYRGNPQAYETAPFVFPDNIWK